MTRPTMNGAKNNESIIDIIFESDEVEYSDDEEKECIYCCETTEGGCVCINEDATTEEDTDDESTEEDIDFEKDSY